MPANGYPDFFPFKALAELSSKKWSSIPVPVQTALLIEKRSLVCGPVQATLSLRLIDSHDSLRSVLSKRTKHRREVAATWFLGKVVPVGRFAALRLREISGKRVKAEPFGSG